MVAGIAVAGCGGSGATLDFAAKAIAICNGADRKLPAIERPGPNPLSRSEVVRDLEVMWSGLRALRAPGAEEARYSAMLRSDASVIADLRRLLPLYDRPAESAARRRQLATLVTEAHGSGSSASKEAVALHLQGC